MPPKGERFACLFCLLHTRFEQNVQTGLQVTAWHCLPCKFEVSERKPEGPVGLSPIGTSRGACPRVSRPHARERLCWLPSSGKAGFCLLPLLRGAQQSANSSGVFWHRAAAPGGWRGWKSNKPPGPARGCFFSLPKLHRGGTPRSVCRTGVIQWWARYQCQAKHQLFPVWSRNLFP